MPSAVRSDAATSSLPAPEIAARAANGGSPSSRRRARSGSTRRPGSASRAAWTTSWRGRNVCTSSRPPCWRPPVRRAAADEQRHRLLGGPVARREQLGVDVEEGDDVGPRARGAGRPRCRRRSRPSAGGSSSRPVTATTGRPAAASSSSRSRVDAGTQVGERRRPALQAHRRAHRAAAPTRQRAVVVEPDGGVAHRAAGQRAARPAGEDPRPARRVVHAHDGAIGHAGGRSAATSRATSSTARRGCGRRARRSASRLAPRRSPAAPAGRRRQPAR